MREGGKRGEDEMGERERNERMRQGEREGKDERERLYRGKERGDIERQRGTLERKIEV